MSIWNQKSKILVTCPKGVSPYLKKEIEALDFPVLAELDTAIQTEGTLQDTMILKSAPAHCPASPLPTGEINSQYTGEPLQKNQIY